MMQKGANKKIESSDIYKALEKDAYFTRELDIIREKRGKTFTELGDFYANLLVKYDCLNCIDHECKNRRHAFKQPIRKNELFFTCSMLVLVKPSKAEMLKQQEQAERSAKIAADVRHQTNLALKEKLRKWLLKDDNTINYCIAACEIG
jgi:hypothetical protein